jgi:hypothetical protein
VKTSHLALQQPMSEGVREDPELPSATVKRDDLMARRVQDELLLLDMKSERIHQLNETASFIWDMWNQVPDTKEIARLLAQKFDVAEDIALSDVTGIVAKLRELELLAG